MTEPDLERRLTEIRDEIRDVKQLLIGSNGDDGALSRVTKLEQRHGFLMTSYLWLLAGVLALLGMVVPSYFQRGE